MNNENNSKNSQVDSENVKSESNTTPSLDKSKFGSLQILTAAQVVTLLVKSDSSFAGPCGY